MLGVFKSDKDKSLNDPLITAEEGGGGKGKAKEDHTIDYSVSSTPADTGDPTNGQGLTDGQVLALRAEWGENKLPENKKSKLYLLLLAFTSPMACLIWVAALIEQPSASPSLALVLIQTLTSTATLMLALPLPCSRRHGC